jgi:hypothetical protein
MANAERLPPLCPPITPESAASWLHEARLLLRQLRLQAVHPDSEERWLVLLQALEALRDAHEEVAAMSETLRETSEMLRAHGHMVRTRGWPPRPPPQAEPSGEAEPDTRREREPPDDLRYKII